MIEKSRPMPKQSKKHRYVPDLKQDLASCDANYIRFLRLFPDYQSQDELVFALEMGDETVGVRIEVTERCPYTTFVDIKIENGLTYLTSLFWPSLSVGLYHDLSTAEVLAIGDHQRLHQRYEVPNAAMHHPDEKSQVNRALGELLSVCIEQGRVLESVLIGDD
ncbi:MAG: DUF1249 domain-containing protein [Pseudomonadales bacterium]|jgi:uncharacterized protein YqiB (DUF1249 family)|nr:DUF1249 domain-containing protein [Pseudomonadales bacterium]MDA0762243.1 DUF1249 domain-containing protein [Pseudomonadota bacterium]MDA0956220.1 DUF1249 domain-containing protein [Pseudomonadota bacterium]MDA1206581.1 DUF1249 domain-containing protein [Pseudomonadota bacterium]